MTTLQLRLLESPATVAVDDVHHPRLASGKSLALLSYLAIEGGTHPRTELASLLWGESTDTEARSSLRQLLKRLRDTMGEAIQAGRSEVSLAGECSCDVRDFLVALDESPAKALEYRIHLFAQHTVVRRAPMFQEWADGIHQDLRRRYVRVAEAVGQQAARHSEWVGALTAADHWLATEPHAEGAIRLIMESLFMLGRRDDALARYRSFVDALRRDLEVEASEEVVQLAQRIESEKVPRRSEGGRRSDPVFASRIVGREREWEELTRGWESAAKHGCRVFVVEGEAGVGKSRITEEFCKWAAAGGGLVLRGRGYGPNIGMPYGPVADAFRKAINEPGLAGTAPEFLGEATLILPELRELFRGLPESSDARDTGRRSRLFESLAQVLIAISEDRNTVLAIDDLQWCDSETCALLHYFARRLDQASVVILLCVTAGKLERDTAVARFTRAIKSEPRTNVISLKPLLPEDTAKLVHEMGNISTPTGGKRLAERIYEITDGNPFYTIEVLKTLFANKVLAVDEATGEWVAVRGLAESGHHRVELPHTVREAVTGRIEVLPYEMRDLMALVSVSGRGVDTDDFALICGISRLRAGALADDLVDKLLLVERDGRFHPAHPIIGDVVRESMTRSRRRQLHRALAVAADAHWKPGDDPETAGEIARHADLGGESTLAYAYGLKASEAALDQFAFDESLSWLDLAARHASTDEEKLAVNRRTASLLEQSGGTLPPPAGTRTSQGGGFVIEEVDLRIGNTDGA